MDIASLYIRFLIIAFLVAFLVIFFSVQGVNAELTIDEFVYSTGGSSSVNSQTWVDADKITSVWGDNSGKYSEGAAGQQIVTGPGRSTIEMAAVMGAGFNQSTVVTNTGQMAAWDTLSMESLILNESELECTASQIVYNGADTVTTGSTPAHVWADGQVGVMGTNGRYESDKTNDDTSYGLSGRADINGSFYGDLATGTETGRDTDSNIKNHEDGVYRHVFGGSAGKVSGKIDWIWDDYEDPINVTAVDEVVNNTTEEA